MKRYIHDGVCVQDDLVIHNFNLEGPERSPCGKFIYRKIASDPLQGTTGMKNGTIIWNIGTHTAVRQLDDREGDQGREEMNVQGT